MSILDVFSAPPTQSVFVCIDKEDPKGVPAAILIVSPAEYRIGDVLTRNEHLGWYFKRGDVNCCWATEKERFKTEYSWLFDILLEEHTIEEYDKNPVKISQRSVDLIRSILEMKECM